MEKFNSSVTPIFTNLKSYKKQHFSSFHTPGHKNSSFLSKINFSKLDFTELPATDDLFFPSSSILQAEKNAAEIFKTKKTLFSSGGCSLCLQTMLRLAFPNGGKIITSRIIHKSAVNAMALLNIEPIYLTPEKDLKTNFFKAISPQKIENALKENPDVKAVFITSPDYFGTLSDIKAISKICKKFGVLLLVDNAHGSHLGFLKKDLHPIHLGADMCTDSAHKTLPVFTGGAFLHINNSKFLDLAKKEMQLFASTSPSFPILTSLDLCCSFLKKHGKKSFLKLEKNIENIKNLALKAGLIFQDSLCDPIRLSFNTSKIGLSGKDFSDYLRKFKIEPEFYIDDFVVLIPTPFNKKTDFKRLKKALINLPKLSYNPVQESKNNFYYFEEPKIAATLSQTLFSESYKINTKDSLGKVSKYMICPCPPGVPILLPGEIITNSIIENLINYGIFSLDVLK